MPTLQPHQFPPYGRMVAEYESDIQGAGTPPRDWHGPADWLGWRGKLVELVAMVLWPRYDRTSASWRGASVADMSALTNTDFEVLRALRPVIDQPTPIGSGTMKQQDLFELEDEGDVKDQAGSLLLDRSLDKTLEHYLTGLADAAHVKVLVKGLLPGLAAKSGSVDLQLKQFFQRPRAFQMSYLMGEDWFSHQHAKSAVSPALISGHCFQGSMGGIANFYASRALPLDEAAKIALMRHTVDVGDRRVFAGVHYPSDNISSWITALLVAPLTCPDADGAGWLWRAVQTHSQVYAAIEGHLGRNPTSPYARSMRLLKAMGAAPGITVEQAIETAAASS